MQLAIQTQLVPDADQAASLDTTVHRFNAAADWLADVAHENGCANKYELQKRHYRELRTRFDLSAQMAVRAIAQVAGALRRDRSFRPRFRPDAAMPYDARILSRRGDAVSILTLAGRTIIPFICGKRQQERLDLRWGECDLLRRGDGKWFLIVTVDVAPREGPLPREFIGLDFGVENHAATSDGVLHVAVEVERARRRYAEKRRRLQIKAAAQTVAGKRAKNVRRKLKTIARREARFRRDVNHGLSKSLVKSAGDTGRGLALELLTRIRDRTRFRKAQRARMSGWSFAQLRAFVEYKAELAGVLVSIVSPRNTSRQCFACKYVDKRNRRSQAEFACVRCGHVDHADVNAAKNIAYRAAVNLPLVSMLVLMRELASGTSSVPQGGVA
ncbi:MAG TPA: transposase [Candidatus Baltobacteraceae bacterium]|nr:transposase [Candidatus Baltobacteraceae bacterium]